VVKPELGIKRLCTECGAKFYDLLKNPIVCPKCGATYAVVTPTPKSKPAAAQAAPAPVVAEAVAPVVVEEAAELVSLEDAEAEQASTGAKGAKLPEDEIEVEEAAEDAAEDDSTFLVEEEEEDTNVTDLIDGEIEKEEEP
jgi:uncharacterized protein (TIGR02300 family)